MVRRFRWQRRGLPGRERWLSDEGPLTTVFVHGGVSGRARGDPPRLRYAVEAGARHAGALDAAEAAVRALEDDPATNAGLGATVASDGSLELEAGIADGTAGRFGAIANVAVRHPISAARLVMEETPHVLLTGRGAEAFVSEHALEPLEELTPEVRAQWEAARRAGTLTLDHYGRADRVDTVGAVALGELGALAAASSTGGVFGKLPGRVGDSPVFGAGIYACKEASVVGTGVGELFVETLACFRTAMLIEQGSHPQKACEEVIWRLGAQRTSSAGLLALDASGRSGAAYRGGSWRVEGPDGVVAAVRLE